MSILSFLLGTESRPKNHRITETSSDVTFDDSFLYASSMDYFGFYKISNSKEWVISWADFDKKKHVGGYRESGYGRFILYNKIKDKIVMNGELQRPNHGHVADTGVFSIEDWGFGPSLKGTFYVYSPDGEIVIEKNFAANIYNSAVSLNGRFAVCQTCNAKSDDGNKFTAFDISAGQELFSVTPLTGWADQYQFDEECGQIVVVHNRIGKFRYTLDGTFLDEKKFENDKLVSGDFVAILMTVEKILKEKAPSHEELNNLLSAISHAKSLQTGNSNGWDAIAFKLEGITLEKLGQYEDAGRAFKKALTLNPKIRVAKRLEVIQKKLTS
ncbi:MAG: hypothetical protein SFW62_06315 [Alphaproteobacteria bacterium]|nr:hypothetical protein [Alphaproteobacteria bacterium]